jgi:hypothetical protein
VYRKEADRLIVRDVCRRLKEMHAPDWQLAVVASMHEHPDWYSHHGIVLDEVGQLLEAAGLQLVRRESERRWIGNEGGLTDE